MPSLQRKYIDLIRHISSEWINWNPLIPIEVGAYGELESETGDLRVEGNIYTPEFQAELDKLGIPLRMAEHQPQEREADQHTSYATKGAKGIDLSAGPAASIPGFVNASFKGQWQFERGRRDALFIMPSARTRFLPPNVVLDKLYQVPQLANKLLVTSVHICPAYSMYLSNKSGEKIALALAAQVPVLGGIPGVTAGGEADVGWWSDTQADLLRKGYDKKGNYSYTPLYMMKRQLGWLQRLFREGEEQKQISGDDLWQDVNPPWDPLNEDGDEDLVEVDEAEDPNEF